MGGALLIHFHFIEILINLLDLVNCILIYRKAAQGQHALSVMLKAATITNSKIETDVKIYWLSLCKSLRTGSKVA